MHPGSSGQPAVKLEDLVDIEAIQRMVALSCAAWTTGDDEDSQRTLAVAASYLEFIDPLADPEFLKRPVSNDI